MVMKVLWKRYVIVVEWSFIDIAVILYGLADYGLVMHGCICQAHVKYPLLFLQNVNYTAEYLDKKYGLKVGVAGTGVEKIYAAKERLLIVKKIRVVIKVKTGR